MGSQSLPADLHFSDQLTCNCYVGRTSTGDVKMMRRNFINVIHHFHRDFKDQVATGFGFQASVPSIAHSCHAERQAQGSSRKSGPKCPASESAVGEERLPC